jgi:ferritin-like metal-binding protein YciE
MRTAYELFRHELRDMLNAESRLVITLTEMQTESSQPEVVDLFETHRKETERQAARLVEIFGEIGEPPEQADCKGIEGLIKEKRNFVAHKPSQELLDIFNVSAGIKAERYEISAYESLIRLARELKFAKAEQLLNETMREEEHALQKLMNIAEMLKPSELGVQEVPPALSGGDLTAA